MYGRDQRLNLNVRAEQPKMNMDIEIPETLGQGELR